MSLLDALQAAYAQGLGCRPVGCGSGVVYWLERCGPSYRIRAYSPATRRSVDFLGDGGPVLLSEWLRPHEPCPLPLGVEPEVRPVPPRPRVAGEPSVGAGPTTIADLARLEAA